MKQIHPAFFFVVSFTALLLTACRKSDTAPSAMPPEVRVITVPAAEGSISSEVIATLDGSTNTPIHSQVSGYLVKQAYQEGAVVKAGDLLFEINGRPFPNDRERADAAQVPLATASESERYTRIASPIEGVAGRAALGVGDLVTPSVTLTTISTVDPILADFFWPDPLARRSAFPTGDQQPRIELITADGTAYPLPGKLSSIQRQNETASRAISACALFPNPDRVLRPGQYVKVRITMPNMNKAVLIPQRCVAQLQGKNQVVVVKADNTVEMRNVTLGDRAGSDWIVTDGLQAGERVVVEGVEKCTPGGLVTPKPFVETPSPTRSSTSSPASNAPTSTPPEIRDEGRSP